MSALVVLLVLLTLSFGRAFAGGFSVPHQTARGLALSSALTAGVTDPSAVYYNPAALSEVEGNNLLASGSYINVISSVKNSGRKAVNIHDDNYLATLFANYHIPGTDLTAGIGSYVPFGLATSYEQEFVRFAAQRTQLRTIYVTPALSWHPSKYFSIGGGLSFVHSSGMFSRALCFDALVLDGGCATLRGPFEGRMRITDTADAFTYNIGLLIKPVDNLKFGFSYRARADLRFDTADVKLRGPFSSSVTRAKVRPVPLPPVANVGAYWQINPSWGAEFVYEHTRWSEFKSFGATFSPSVTFLPLGAAVTTFSLPQNWKNTTTLRLGSFYRLSKNLELRTGVTIDETPIPSRTLNPAIPGADRITLNAGIGYTWEKISIDVGYMAVFYKSRRVTNNELEGLPATNIPFLGAPGKDKYETFNNFVSLSLNYRF